MLASCLASIPARTGHREPIKELRDRSRKLHRRKGFLEHYAVGNTLCRPFVGCYARHVDYGKIGIDIACRPRDLPAAEPSKRLMSVTRAR